MAEMITFMSMSMGLTKYHIKPSLLSLPSTIALPQAKKNSSGQVRMVYTEPDSTKYGLTTLRFMQGTLSRVVALFVNLPRLT